MPDPPIVAASVLAADFSRLREEIESVEAAGADWLHLDVMDGHFVDNISYGPAFCNAVKSCARLPLDVHLMIDRPDHFLPRFTESASNITVHVEAPHDAGQTLRAIREAGCTAGLSLNPATPFEQVAPYLDQIDLLLVMTVVPGFGGQEFMEEQLEKVERACELRQQQQLRFRIEVDGGIAPETARLAVERGAEVLVAGTSIFKQPDLSKAIAALRG